MPNGDVMSMRQSNILDPIHAELDPRVWDDPSSPTPKLKPKHVHWIKNEIYTTLEKAGYTDIERWLELVFTGSLTTYQYGDTSDCDISLFVDSKVFPEWSRAEMIGLMVEKLDGRMLPGTPFPLQDFVVAEGIRPHDLYKPGLRSGYSLDTLKWIVPPERDRAHDVKAEQGGFYAWALQMADKMESLLRYEPDKALDFWHNIHHKRQRDMRQGKGDYAESNIIYKMLANRGLFPKLEDISGEYIAKTAASDWFAPSYMVPDDVKEQIHEWAHTLPWPLGSRMNPHHRYHVTGLYSPSGYSDPEHHAWVESKSGLTYPVQTTGLESFSPGEKGHPVVLRVHHPQMQADTEALMDEGEARGLPVSRFPGGYKGHITLGYSPTPVEAENPGMTFPVGPLRELHSVYDAEKPERTAKTKPPNLRKATGQKRCSSCWAFKDRKCEMFDGYPVEADETCDDWQAVKTAGTARVLYNKFRPDPVHPGGMGEPTMPFIYDPDTGVVHLGPVGSYHFQLVDRTPELRPQYPESGEWTQPPFAVNPHHVHGAMEWPSRAVKFLGVRRPEHEDDIREALGAPTPTPEESHRWEFTAGINADAIAHEVWTKAEQGEGITINLMGEAPVTRYGYAPNLDTQTPFKLDHFTPADVLDFIERWHDRLSEPGKYLGSWIQGNSVILDVTEGHDDFSTAFERAWSGHQKSMWDNDIQDEIPVRGLDYVQPIGEVMDDA